MGSQSQSQLSPGGWEAALHNLHPSPSPCIVLQAAGLHGPRVSKLRTKPELAFFIFQAFLVDRCQRRKRKMATLGELSPGDKEGIGPDELHQDFTLIAINSVIIVNNLYLFQCNKAKLFCLF